MNYSFVCSCGHKFDVDLPMAEYKKPLSEQCPSCKEVGNIKRDYEAGLAAISYRDSKSDLRRAGSGWTEVLKKIKKTAGKNNTINV